MKDYLPFGDEFKGFLEAALLPAATAVGLFAFFVYPTVPNDSQLGELATLPWSQRLIVLGISALVVAEIATLLRSPARNLLEGHRHPTRPRFLLAHHRSRRANAVTELQGPESDRKKSIARLGQDLKMYPLEERFVMPTRLGNLVKAAETYGITRFRLDTPTFYFELRRHAGDRVVADLDRQSLGIDAAVSAIIIALQFALVSLAVAVWAGSAPPAFAAAIAALVAIGAYQLACSAAKGYIGAMRALVNEGRMGLAEGLGLTLPPSLAEERQLWRNVSNYVFWGPGPAEGTDWSGTAAREAAWLTHARDRGEPSVDHAATAPPRPPPHPSRPGQ